jgi:hypothetical protein
VARRILEVQAEPPEQPEPHAPRFSVPADNSVSKFHFTQIKAIALTSALSPLPWNRSPLLTM